MSIKERIIGAIGSVSGFTSILGSWQVCHSACLGLIALLSVIGITLTGMPLAFLTTVAIPLWSLAVLLLLATMLLYAKRRCISKRLILFNSGLIIAGVPFQPAQEFSMFFWVVGGTIAAVAIVLFAKDKLGRRKVCR